MFKKLLVSSAILAIASSTAFAGAPYIGARTGVIVNTATNVNFRGLPGTLFGGYGAGLGQGFYLGGEVFVTLGSATITDNGLKSGYAYGFGILPGILISDHTMGYLRVGLVQTQFSPTNQGNSTVTGGQLGLGLQTSLTQNWDLRGEYTYTASKSVKGVSGNPRTDETTIAMVYKVD
ncbi:MAG: outer membrane beta-barrel protein [Pseudomonadota bacterium]